MNLVNLTIDQITTLIRSQPDNPLLYLQRALALHQDGESETALEDLDTVDRLSDSIDTDTVRAAIHYDHDRFDQAIEILSRIIVSGRGDADTNYFRALATHHRGRPGDHALARTDFKTAYDTDPDRAAYNYGIGLTLISIGQTPRALEHAAIALHRADETEPREDYHILRGRCRNLLGDADGALDDFGAAAIINPNMAVAYENIACVETLRDQFESALKNANVAVRLRPDFGKLMLRASILRHLGDTEGALSDIDECLRLEPGNPEPYILSVRIYMAEGRKRQAIKACREMTARTDSPGLAMTLLASILLGQGRTGAAMEILNKIIASTGTDARDQALHLRGKIREKAGQTDEALSDYSLALRSNQDNTEARVSRGLLLIKQGKRDPGMIDLSHVGTAARPGPADEDAMRRL